MPPFRSHPIPAAAGARRSSAWILAALLASAAACAETIDWYTVDSGGGSSSGSGYTVTGTVGQSDAGAAPAGANGIAGGFWAGVQSAPPGGSGIFTDSFE